MHFLLLLRKLLLWKLLLRELRRAMLVTAAAAVWQLLCNGAGAGSPDLQKGKAIFVNQLVK